jgi:hypothetical protein
LSNIGSVTIKCEFAANSGNWLTSSTIAINSGGGTFSVFHPTGATPSFHFRRRVHNH